MADGTPDRAAATLDEIRAFGYKSVPQGSAVFEQAIRAARDVPRLLAAVEAALKEADRLDSGRGDYGHLVNRHEAAGVFRRTITAALTGPL